MKPSQIEAWALRVIERVEAKQPNEDSCVELKRKWPTEPDNAARRIAGHANAAQGEPILWLIGVDQDAGVVGAAHADLATWWPRVRAEFEGLPPTVRDLNVPWKGLTVVGLLFETDRAPFVVKNPTFGKPGGGPVALEVPWREGTAIRSARRDELLRLLAPLQLLPEVEVMNGWLSLSRIDDAAAADKLMTVNPRCRWELWLDLYVAPRGEQRVTIPFHRCSGAIDFPQPQSSGLDFDEVRLRSHYSFKGQDRTYHKLSVTIESTHAEVHFDGPGCALLTALAWTPTQPSSPIPELGAAISLQPIGADRPVPINALLRQTTPQGGASVIAAWQFGKHPWEWRPDLRWSWPSSQ
jgi:hypothetical protein